MEDTQKRVFILIGILAVLIIVLVFVFFLRNLEPAPEPAAPIETNEPVSNELTEEQQLEILDELAPEDPIDTTEERENEIDLLEQLRNQ